jgi:hypothetical protein
MNLCKVTLISGLRPHWAQRNYWAYEKKLNLQSMLVPGPENVVRTMDNNSTPWSTPLLGPEKLMSLRKVTLVPGLRPYWAERSW